MTTASPEATLQSRTRLLAVVVVLLTLIAGVGIGWAIGRPHGPRGMGRGGPRPEMGHDGPGGPGHMFAGRLKLSPTQEKAIDSIFTASRTQIAAFWDGPGAQLKQIIDSTGLKVRTVLDSTQRVEFDRMQARRDHGPDGRGRGPWEGRGPGGRYGDRGGSPPGDVPGGPPPRDR